MAKIYPSLEVINNMPTPPTNGEAFLLRFLIDNLDESYEVYYQARVEGKFPDVVIIRPDHGVLIIEVKDWNLSLYREDKVEPYNWICHTSNGVDVPLCSPVEQVKMYKNLFYEIYSRSLAAANALSEKDHSVYAIISTAVFFFNETQQQLTEFFDTNNRNRDLKYTIILGRDDLEKNRFSKIVGEKAPFFINDTYHSYYFTEKICDEIRYVLSPSKHFIKKLNEITWTNDQKKLYRSIPHQKAKVRGEAGCGKTLTMAHRAIDAYKKTKSKVLILTFNITLCHYIRDVINQLRHRDPEFKDTKNFMRNFRIQHFHLFIKLFAIEHEIIKNKKKANTYDIIETDVKEFEKYKGYYKTILVDEIQDYEREWVDIIRALADENTELIFWGDEEQNIYNRLQDKEGMHKHRCYTGIRGNWNRIHGSHRVQGNIANLALSFQKVFLYDYDDNRIEPTMDDLFMPETHVEYHFLDNMATEIIFYEVDRFVKKYKIHQDDICYLSNIVAPVREIEAELNKRGYRTITTFETEAEYQALSQKYQSDEYIKEKLENIRRAAKFRFEMESGKIKLATIHSYKGWGINTEVLIISNNSNEHITPQLIYTAITRAVSNLLIFSIGSKKYHEFFNYTIP